MDLQKPSKYWASMFFGVLYGTVEASMRRGYFWGYFVFSLGVFSGKRNSERTMALTDTEIKRTKAKEQAYNMRGGGGLHLRVTTMPGVSAPVVKPWEAKLTPRPPFDCPMILALRR
jgi:hypothetical protein